MNQVRQQNMENQRKQKERAVRKLLKMITTDRPSERTIPEVCYIYTKIYIYLQLCWNSFLPLKIKNKSIIVLQLDFEGRATSSGDSVHSSSLDFHCLKV